MFFLLSGLLAHARSGATVTVTVRGAATDQGHVRCQVFRGPDGFPSGDTKATACAAAPVHEGLATCAFFGHGPGRLAIAAYRSETSDAKLDPNLVGWPAKGVGLSNGATAGLLGPPAWDEAAEVMGTGSVTVPLVLTR